MSPMPVATLAGPLAAIAFSVLAPSLDPASAQQAVVYQPPDRDAPPARVSGGTRNADSPQVELRVLAPDHPGLTISEQPTLYWYLSSDVDRPAVLTIVEDDIVDPVVEMRLEPPLAAGIQSVPLAGQEVRLKANKPYHWGVTLVFDASSPFKDLYAGASIERITPSTVLKAKLADTKTSNRAAVLAQSGIWYDAVDAISVAIARAPDEHWLRDQRRRLLEQVGLPGVAAGDADE